MFEIFSDIPGWLLFIIIVGLSVLGSAVMARFIRNLGLDLPADGQHVRGSESGLDSIFADIAGVLYALLLAFVVIAVWDQYEAARLTAVEEGAMLDSLWHMGLAYPEEDAARITSALTEYADAVSEDEWETLGHGHSSQRASVALAELRAAHYELDLPSTNRYSSLYSHSVDKLEAVAEHRLRREIQSNTLVPDIVLVVLAVTGLLLVVLVSLTAVENQLLHMVVIAACGVVLGLTFFLIIVLDNPWSGAAAIEPEAFEHLHEMREQMGH